MKGLQRRIVVSLVGSGLLPLAAQAATLSFECGMTHYVRSGGTEMVSSTLSVRNADPSHAATILRLTVRDGDGNVVHDAGPLTATPLPLNTDFPSTHPAGRDITVVPPGGAVYLRSNHLWGNNGLPSGAAGNESGQILTATLVVTKVGPPAAISVNASQRMRTRAAGAAPGSFVETDSRAASTVACDTLR